MKKPKSHVPAIVLAMLMALPLAAISSCAHADELGGADAAGTLPMMRDAANGPGAPGGPGMRGPGPGMQPGGPGGREGRGGPGMEAGGPGDHGLPPGGPGWGGHARLPFMHGIELSEAQDDKVFAILHAQEPYLREQGKAAAKAHEALRALGDAAQYDDAKAAVLAQAEAQAMANIALQQVRTRQKLLAVLTPEQRQKQQEAALQAHQPHPPRP